MMIKYNSKEKFKEIKGSSYYLRVDDVHPLDILLGLNDEGKKNIRLLGNFKKTKIKRTKAIDVNHFESKEKLIISFSLASDDYLDLFYLFCDDLIDSSRNINPKDGYTFFVNRYEKWRYFASSMKKYLSDIEIKGLLGELLFLNNHLIDKFGISKAIQGWTGPEPTKKDFSYEQTWYEIKVVSKESITISSIEQLESDSDGYLVLYYLEKMSPEATGYTLNNVVESVIDQIELDQDKELFIMKLLSLGFYKEEYYDSYVFKTTRVEFYIVNDEFPKIKKNMLPNAISNIKYDIIIKMIEKFKREYL